MMAGESRYGGDDDWVLPSPALADVTLAIVGKIGSGKSATANSILGNKAFPSEHSYSGVTETCQMRSRTFHDGFSSRTLNVIDTPGLFDMDTSTENVRKEIFKCNDMAKDGIHAMLMVFSAVSRFSCEDDKTFELIKLFFGDQILDHMILVFTHGDLVGEEITWKKRLTASAPGCVQDMLNQCKNRVVLFDNKTTNKKHREAQLKNLLDAVDFVISSNCGKPFSNQITRIQEAHIQKEISIEGYSAEQISKLKKDLYDECLAGLGKMVEETPNSTITRLEKQLLEEQKARLDWESKAAVDIIRLEEEIHRLRKMREKAWEMPDKAKKESDNARKEIEKLKERVRTLEKNQEIKNEEAKKQSDNAQKEIEKLKDVMREIKNEMAKKGRDNVKREIEKLKTRVKTQEIKK